MKSISWTGVKGNKYELRAQCEIRMVDNTIDADGDILVIGKKPYSDGILEFWMDGNLIESSCNVDLWSVTDAYDNLKKVRGLSRCGLLPAQAELVAAFLKDVKESGKTEEYKAYEAEHKAKERAGRVAEAQKVVDEAAKYTQPLMTEAEYRAWKKRYNDTYNEGGDGYIPSLITIEQFERAKKILAEE
jgi:hypothetical protein